jgi:uncharacterized protein
VTRAVFSSVVALLLLSVSAVWAEVVNDLHSAEVPVVDRTQPALNSASRDGLAQVLVKVSGSSDVLSNPAIQSALPQARSYVQQYAYAVGRDNTLLAKFEFNDTVIAGLLRNAGAPLWTANRPPVLAWVVIETSGGRQFLGQDTDPVLVDELRAAFFRRGVPVQLPLFDLADSAALSTSVAWQQDTDALKAASARYGVGDILAGRVVVLTTGSWAGDWAYLGERNRIDRSISANSSEDFLQAGVDVLAEDMASRYAVLPSGVATGGIVMSVSGVTSYADYAGIVSWLEGLELIEHANVELITGDQVQLRLVAQADSAQLASIIELNDKLVPLPVPQRDGELAYRWQK